MKKTFNVYAICWAILLAAFNLIAFITPSHINESSKWSGAFWIGYVFITLAFIGQLVCTYFAFKESNKQRFFYNISLIAVSYFATILMIVVGAACMIVPFIPSWVGAIVCILILAFSTISVLKAKATIDIVSQIDAKIKVETFFIKSLTVDAEAIIAKAESEEIKTQLKKVYELVRYSDPVSDDALADIESQIKIKFSMLTEAVEVNNAEAVREAASEVIILVNDRNKKLKMLK